MFSTKVNNYLSSYDKSLLTQNRSLGLNYAEILHTVLFPTVAKMNKWFLIIRSPGEGLIGLTFWYKIKIKINFNHNLAIFWQFLDNSGHCLSSGMCCINITQKYCVWKMLVKTCPKCPPSLLNCRRSQFVRS